MIDKKKLAIFGIIAAVVVAGVVAGIIWAYNNSEPATPTTPTTESTVPASPTESTASPTGSAEASASPTGGKFDGLMSFDKDAEKIAGNAALNAAIWSSPVAQDVNVQRYLSAGFSKDLAESFEPVWKDIYDPEKLTYFGVTAAADRVWLSDASGEENAHSYRVGVLISYDIEWSLREGSDSGSPKAEATWWVTLDEKTGKVTEIDQPTKGELNIDISK